MRLLPISVREPTIGPLTRGEVAQLRRPSRGLLARCAPGDLLWVREPFHLADKFDALSPTAAARFGARPYFVSDFKASRGPPGLGPRRYARNLLRIWSRQHLVVTAVDPVPLQSISDSELHAQGYRTRAAYAGAWDAGISLNGSGTWRDNPTVLLLTFRHVLEPAPGLNERV